MGNDKEPSTTVFAVDAVSATAEITLDKILNIYNSSEKADPRHGRYGIYGKYNEGLRNVKTENQTYLPVRLEDLKSILGDNWAVSLIKNAVYIFEQKDIPKKEGNRLSIDNIAFSRFKYIDNYLNKKGVVLIERQSLLDLKMKLQNVAAQR